MEEGQDKLINVAKEVLLNLIAEKELMEKRFGLLQAIPANEYMPENPVRPFEASKAFVENERELTLLQVKNHKDKLQGQIEGQTELIYKLSTEGEAEEKARLEMIRDNSDMKTQIKVLETKLEKYESIEKDGKKE